MKTIILYASKYGAAKEIAERLSKALGGAELCDLAKSQTPDISCYDAVVLGGSIYAGMVRKQVKTFASQNEKALEGKRLGLFLSGIAEDGENYFKSNFPESLVNSAAAKEMLGGIIDPKKAGAFERWIVAKVAKQSGYINTITDEKINAFAAMLVG